MAISAMNAVLEYGKRSLFQTVTYIFINIPHTHMHSGYKEFIYYAEFPQEFHLMMNYCSAVLCICCATGMTSKTSGWHAAHSDGLSILSTSFVNLSYSTRPLWTSLDPFETSLSNCLHRCLFV